VVVEQRDWLAVFIVKMVRRPTVELFSWLAPKKRTFRKGTRSFLMATTLAGKLVRCNFVNYLLNFCPRVSNAIAALASGSTNFGGVSYSTTVQNITGLLKPGSTGVNHGIWPVPAINSIHLLTPNY
jgi:hypothetical protein